MLYGCSNRKLFQRISWFKYTLRCNTLNVKLTSIAKFETRADATDMVVLSFHVGFAYFISVHAQRNPPFRKIS